MTTLLVVASTVVVLSVVAVAVAASTTLKSSCVGNNFEEMRDLLFGVVLPLGCSEKEGIGKLLGAGELTPAHRGDVESDDGGEELKGGTREGFPRIVVEKDEDLSFGTFRGEGWRKLGVDFELAVVAFETGVFGASREFEGAHLVLCLPGFGCFTGGEGARSMGSEVLLLLFGKEGIGKGVEGPKESFFASKARMLTVGAVSMKEDWTGVVSS